MASLVLCFATAHALGQDADWFVDDSAPSGGNGFTWATAFQGIQDAVNVASSGHHIAVAEGTYTNTSTGANSIVNMAENVHIHGGFLGLSTGNPNTDYNDPDGSFDLTILDGEADETHVVTATNFGAEIRTIIDGFMIKNGLADGTPMGPTADRRGAGVFIQGMCTFIKVENSRLKNNVADDVAGAVFHNSDGAFECEKSIIEENYSPKGAGFYTLLTDDNIFANVVFRYNGAIAQPPGGPPVTDEGGAIWFLGGELEVMNCVFHDNEAVAKGGAVYWDPSTLGNLLTEWSHCTFAFNRTLGQTGGSNDGSGIHILPGPSTTEMRINNSILWKNTPGYDIWLGSSPRVTLTLQYSDIGTSLDTSTGMTITGTALLSQDPKFKNEPLRNLRLSSASPCIDAGNPALLPPDTLDLDEDVTTTILPVDLDLRKRTIDGDSSGVAEPDMGAYEGSGA